MSSNKHDSTDLGQEQLVPICPRSCPFCCLFFARLMSRHDCHLLIIIIIMSILCILNSNLETSCEEIAHFGHYLLQRTIRHTTGTFCLNTYIDLELSRLFVLSRTVRCSHGPSAEHFMHRFELSLVELSWPQKSSQLPPSHGRLNH